MSDRVSTEVFKVGDTVTWGGYITFRWHGRVGPGDTEGPFVVTEVRPADSPFVGHSQLVKVKGCPDGEDWFSGLWFTKVKEKENPKNKFRRIILGG